MGKTAESSVLKAPGMSNAHVGISIFDPATGKYLYNYQGDKYFVPASNTKIPTCYAAMKYLGDSLVGLRFRAGDEGFIIKGTGDPSFLHADFPNQPVFEFLKRLSDISFVRFSTSNWKDSRWGSGWAWSDYDEAYMAERSPFPIYGNVARFYRDKEGLQVTPRYFAAGVDITAGAQGDSVQVERDIDANRFVIKKADAALRSRQVPFVTNGYQVAATLLTDTLHSSHAIGELPQFGNVTAGFSKIYSQPTDSLLKPMMHRSDNFFAEQSLLMVSEEQLGMMDDGAILDRLLKTDLSDLPQKPRWVDGSGLSRYNLFTPQDFVAILNKMRSAFGMERLKVILP